MVRLVRPRRGQEPRGRDQRADRAPTRSGCPPRAPGQGAGPRAGNRDGREAWGTGGHELTPLPTATTRERPSAPMAIGHEADEPIANKRGVRAMRSGWAKTAAGFSAVMAVLLVGTWFVLLVTG